jgi:MYXO-CTERM domain-containing protein
MAQYHRPMRPHTSGKAEGDDLYDAWAQLFHDEGMDLVIECDSHTVKRTWPVSPATDTGDEGFTRDDARGTVYVGEGCWGAPLREDDDAKSWTRAHGSFNEVNWLQFYPDRVEVRTIMTDDIGASGSVSDADPFSAPAELPVWNAESGSVLTVPARARDPRCGPPGSIITHEEVIGFGANWRYHDQGQDQGVAWREPGFNDATWPVGAGELGFGDMDEATVIYKSDPNYASYYFRTSFELPLEGGSIVAADLQALYDDGIAVWINGTQVFTKDISDLSHAAYASATQAEASLARQAIDVSALRDGHNVVAALVKQGGATSSDLSFDLSLTLTLARPPLPPDSGMGGGGGSGGASSGGAGGTAGAPVAPEAAGTSSGGSAPVIMQPPGARPSNGADAALGLTGPVAPAPGCACSIPRGPSAASWLVLAGLGLGLWRRRRH